MVENNIKEIDENYRSRILQFSDREREFFKKHGYNLKDWVHLAIEKSIILKEKGIDSLDILQREINDAAQKD